MITPIDKSKESEGVIATYYGVGLRVARANNVAFKRLFKTLIAPHKYQMDNNQSIPDEVSEDIMLQCYSKTILVGWEDYNDAAGKPIPYSVEESYKLLKEDEDAYTFVKNQSNNMDAFMKQEVKETKEK